MQWRILLLMMALTGLAVRRGWLLAGGGDAAYRLGLAACAGAALLAEAGLTALFRRVGWARKLS